jgi:hypothetical protein
LKHLKPISLDTLYDCVANKKALPEKRLLSLLMNGLRQVYEKCDARFVAQRSTCQFFLSIPLLLTIRICFLDTKAV